MKIVQFCNIALAISGKPSATLNAVLEMFDLSPTGDADSAYTLEVIELAPGAPRDTLPRWLADYLHACKPSDQATMVHGPDQECASITVDASTMSCVWFSPQQRFLQFVSQKRRDEKTGLSVTGCLVAILREIAADHDSLLVHAAAVVFPGNSGILLFGDGGGGKSTTSLGALQAGGELLSDDLVAIYATEDAGIQLSGFPEPMNLTPGTLQMFPELCPDNRTDHSGPGSGKKRTDPTAAYPTAYRQSSAPLRMCCFVNISATGPGLTPLSAHDFLGRLIRSHTFAVNQPLTAQSSTLLFQISASIPAYSLQTGPDPIALGRWLSQYCAATATAQTVKGMEPQPQ